MVLCQVVVIKLPPCTDKDRSKAMQIAAATGVVTSVGLRGNERDHLVVVGINIDAVSLTTALRKKFKEASIISIQPIGSVPPRRSRRDYVQYDDDDDDEYMDSPPTDYRRHHIWPSSSYNNPGPPQSYYNYGRLEYAEADDSNPSCCIM